MPTDQPDRSTTAARAPRSANLPVIGPFKALRILGEGGMGIVYLAEQTHPLRRQVALKLVRAGLDTEQVIARFERERQALAMMNHPHVARVYEAGETDDGRPYFAMEYVAGESITKYCDGGRLTNHQRLLIFKDVCVAVQHAHQKGVIHRDIKPSNVLISGPTEEPIPKVIDFGVAKAIGAKLSDDTFTTQFGQFVGTPAYMSPEQANPYFEDVDSRSDIYSLGVLLYELISGVLPFDFTQCLEKGSLGEIQRVILEQEPSLPSTRFSGLGEDATRIAEKHGTDAQHLRRELKGDLDWIVMKALEKDRERRYATALDLARDIERHLRSEPVLAGPPTFGYRARKFIRRRRRALLAGALTLAFVGAATAAGLSIRSLIITREGIRRDARQQVFLEAQLAAVSRPAEAIKLLEKSLEEQPDDLQGLVFLARLLHNENRIEESIAVANKILAGHPQSAAAHLLLAQVYKHRNPTLAEQQRELAVRLQPADPYSTALAMDASQADQAISLLTGVIDISPADFDARWARAWRYYQLAEYQKMYDDAKFLSALRVGSATAWNAQGVALRGLQRPDDAIAAFTKAIRLSSGHALTYLNRSEAYREAGNYELAIADCNQALRLEPGLALAFAHRAGVYLSQDQLQMAEADCNRAIALQQNLGLPYWYRATVAEKSGRQDEALADYDRAVQCEPANPVFLLDRAELRLAMGDYKGAESDCSSVLEVRKDHAYALLHRGRAKMGMEEYDDALADFDRAIRLDASSPYFYHHRARLLRRMGRLQLALQDHDKAVEMSPGSRAPLVDRGITRWLSGQIDLAISDFERGSKLDPSPDDFFLRLWEWQMHFARGEEEEAASSLQRAAEVAGNPWQKHVLAYIQGAESPADLTRAAATDDSSQCELFYYMGAKALADRDIPGARQLFSQCVQVGCKNADEYDLALGRLRTLGQSTSTGPGWP